MLRAIPEEHKANNGRIDNEQVNNSAGVRLRFHKPDYNPSEKLHHLLVFSDNDTLKGKGKMSP